MSESALSLVQSTYTSNPVFREGPNDLRVGDVVDKRYELLRDLGRGAAGVVFEARHRFTHRRVALKLVSPESPRSVQGELRARLLREARALSAARHPSIVDILDGGIAEGGAPYIVLEMLEGGRTLEGILATRGRISVKDAVAVGLQLCDGLAAAHEAGVVHRDVKPGNVILMRDGHGHEVLKLVDFGIARVEAAHECKLTSHGAIVGTPEYMAPEQLLAHAVDHLADVYAVGVTIYECISGHVPHSGNYQEVLLKAGSLAPHTPLVAVAPVAGARLSAVIDKAICKDRSLRYQSMAELAHDLALAIPGARKRTFLFGPPPVPRDPGAPPTVITPIHVSVQPVEQLRKAERANYNTPVHMQLEDGRSLDGRTEDVSTGGLLIITEDGDLATGTRMKVKFALPMEGKIVSTSVVVRWLRVTHGRRAFGVEFENAPPELAPSVKRYVELMGVPKAT